jgi:hypothetical protein
VVPAAYLLIGSSILSILSGILVNEGISTFIEEGRKQEREEV